MAFCWRIVFDVLLVAAAMLVTLAGEAQTGGWAPPDIDAAVPAVNTEAPCPLPEVLKQAGAQVKELVVNLQRFSAHEQIEHVEMDKEGRPRSPVTARFSYVASIREVRPGQLAVEEYRNDSTAVDAFPTKLATTGTAAFALIFHPHYIADFAMSCEGEATVDGRSAWQVRFQQRPERNNNFRGYRVANLWFPVKLKGRAWIDATTHQVLRLQTDLVEPIEKIVQREHVAIEYAAVDFPRRGVQLWLPRQADIYLDYRGRRYHHKHSFSDFQLFWVDTEEKAKLPGR